MQPNFHKVVNNAMETFPNIHLQLQWVPADSWCPPRQGALDIRLPLTCHVTPLSGINAVGFTLEMQTHVHTELLAEHVSPAVQEQATVPAGTWRERLAGLLQGTPWGFWRRYRRHGRIVRRVREELWLAYPPGGARGSFEFVSFPETSFITSPTVLDAFRQLPRKTYEPRRNTVSNQHYMNDWAWSGMSQEQLAAYCVDTVKDLRQCLIRDGVLPFLRGDNTITETLTGGKDTLNWGAAPPTGTPSLWSHLKLTAIDWLLPRESRMSGHVTTCEVHTERGVTPPRGKADFLPRRSGEYLAIYDSFCGHSYLWFQEAHKEAADRMSLQGIRVYAPTTWG